MALSYVFFESDKESIFEKLFNPLAEYSAISAKIEYCKKHNTEVPEGLIERVASLEKEIKDIINS